MSKEGQTWSMQAAESEPILAYAMARTGLGAINSEPNNALMVRFSFWARLTLQVLLLAGGGATALVLAACGGGSSASSEPTKQPTQGPTATSQSKDNKALCDALSTLTADVKGLGTAVASLDRSTINDSLKTIQADWNDFKDEIRTVRSGHSDQIEAAFNNLKKNVTALTDGDDRPSLSTLASSLTSFGTALTDSLAQYRCPGS